MSSDQQDSRPPFATTTELHRQPSSSTPKLLPHTPSPMKPSNINAASETDSTPESRLAAALGRAFMSIPPFSFQDAAAAAATNTNTLLRTLSDADSSVTTTTTTTPPKVPRNNPIRRSLSDTITPDFQKIHKNPLRRELYDTTDYQLLHKSKSKAQRVSSESPQSSTGKQSPKSEEMVMKRIEEMVREIIGQRSWEIEEQHAYKEEIPQQQQKQEHEEEECVGAERLKNGDLRFELSCSCGKRFEMLIKHNGYCFYRLT